MVIAVIPPAGEAHQADEEPHQQDQHRWPECHHPENRGTVQEAEEVVLQQGERTRMQVLVVGIGSQPAVTRHPDEQRRPDQPEKEQRSVDDELALDARRHPRGRLNLVAEQDPRPLGG